HHHHRPESNCANALLHRSWRRRVDDLGRLKPCAWPYRPHVDGGTRHGYRRRINGNPVAADQAARLCRFIVLLRRWGALMVFFWYGGSEASVFNINQSFTILFMIIIGGLGSLLGSFLGA